MTPPGGPNRAVFPEDARNSRGGLIVFNYGDSEAIGTTDEVTEAMFRSFYDLREFWKAG